MKRIPNYKELIQLEHKCVQVAINLLVWLVVSNKKLVLNISNICRRQYVISSYLLKNSMNQAKID